MDEQEKRDKHKSLKDRFVRWQQLTISQLSFTNNLLLALNLGFLSFLITQTGIKFSCICWLSTFKIFSLLSLGLSFITGVLTVLNRLKDFRYTTKLIKNKKLKFEDDHNIKKHADIESIKAEILSNKSLTDALGERTWSLLKWQTWTFAIGTLIGVLYILIYNDVCG